MLTEPWYNKRFDSSYLQYLAAKPHGLTNAEATFIVKCLGVQPNASLLDLCCGTGRHVIELACRGYNVTGLDLSKEYINHAARIAFEYNVNARFVASDMRSIPFESEFDGCYIWYSSFGYLETDEDDLRVLQQASRSLRRNGTILIDVLNQAFLLRHFTPRCWQPYPDGSVVLEQLHFDVITGKNCLDTTIVQPNGDRFSCISYIRMYTFSELARMLRLAGFTVFAAWGDINGSPYSIDSPRMIVCARNDLQSVTQ